jgi:hypothetical protein
MPLVKRDQNEMRLNAIMLLPKQGNGDYYKMLFRSSKNLFYGLGHPDLVDELDFIIHEKIEKVMGTNINYILLTYKNLPFLNSFTRSKNPLYSEYNIYKYTIEAWLTEVEDWIFRQIAEHEGEIRYTLPPKTFI